MPSEAPGSLVQRVAASAAALAGRRVVLLVVSALGTAAVTRFLGPNDYGQFASALATWTLLGAAADFGFSLVLARDLATDAQRRPAMLRAAYEIGGLWAIALTGLLVAIAAIAGFSTMRGEVLLVLAPSVATFGFAAARQVFMVTYRTRDLVRVDLVVIVVQVAVQVAVAAAGLGPVAVAAVISVGSAVNALAIAALARRIVAPARGDGRERRSLLRRALPLGAVSIMTKVYLMIDLVLLGWMVSGDRLGEYAVAAKMLTLLASIPALVTNAALPAFASNANDADELERVSTRIWHWMLVVSLPPLLLTVLFAPQVITITVGPGYDGAASLLRILALAGALGVVGNFLGNIMVAKSLIRPIVTQNVAAITVNVAGNLILIPRFGVAAAAWMTVLTEVVVCSGALVVLRRDLDFRPWLAVTGRPAIAAAAGALVGLALGRWPMVAAPVAVLVFTGMAARLGAWPPELRPRLPSLGRA